MAAALVELPGDQPRRAQDADADRAADGDGEAEADAEDAAEPAGRVVVGRVDRGQGGRDYTRKS